MSPIHYGLALLGLCLLFVGGDVLVRGAVALARRARISPLLIGLTVVAFGTSTPELVVSIQSAVLGQPDIALGNVVGSNIANILLILGLSALVHPLKCRPVVVFRDGAVMTAACLALIGLSRFGILTWVHGLIFLCGLTAYLVLSYLSERKQGLAEAKIPSQVLEETAEKTMSAWAAALLVVGGIAALMLGSKALVAGAVAIARAFGVSEAVIGLTLVAVGTSLPELATSVVASYHRQAEVAVGNVLGSNIFNILCILGVTTLVKPIPINPAIAGFDMWIMLAAAVVLMPFLITGRRLSRIEGAVLFCAYVVYTAVLYR